MKLLLFITFKLLSLSELNQAPKARIIQEKAVISYEFEAEKFLVDNDSILIGCLLKASIMINENESLTFFDTRSTNYFLLREYPFLEKDIGSIENYYDNIEVYHSLCEGNKLNWNNFVFDCDSVQKLHERQAIDQKGFYSKALNHRYEIVHSQYIYLNSKGNFEVVFGIELKGIEYIGINYFLTEKENDSNCFDCQPPINERCPYPEVQDHFIVVGEIYNYFPPSENFIKYHSLKKSKMKKIMTPLAE